MTLCTFLDRPAVGGRNAADDLYAAEYVCELHDAATIGTVGVPDPGPFSEVEAVTLFALGFGLEQAAAGLALLRSSKIPDDTVFGDSGIERLRQKVRAHQITSADSWWRSNL